MLTVLTHLLEGEATREEASREPGYRAYTQEAGWHCVSPVFEGPPSIGWSRSREYVGKCLSRQGGVGCSCLDPIRPT